MTRLSLFTDDQLIGTAGTWLRMSMGSHILVAIPRLRLEHDATMRMAEGASILSLFHGAMSDLDGKPRPTSVMSGQFELFSKSSPSMSGVICFVKTHAEEVPPLGEILRKGVSMLSAQ